MGPDGTARTLYTPAVPIYGPYPAHTGRVVDGDTLDLDVDLGFSITLHQRVRLYGINAPELPTAAGRAAQAYLADLCPPGTPCTLLSHGWDKYGGRCDGEVLVERGSLAERLVAAGHAVPYRT